MTLTIHVSENRINVQDTATDNDYSLSHVDESKAFVEWSDDDIIQFAIGLLDDAGQSYSVGDVDVVENPESELSKAIQQADTIEELKSAVDPKSSSSPGVRARRGRGR